MLALPALFTAPTLAVPATASEATPGASFLVAIMVGLAVLVLVIIALDLRRLRRSSRLRAVHGVMGAAFTAIVVGGTLAMSLAIGSAPSATAEQPDPPVSVEQTPESVPEPESIDTSDITDPATDLQLPTLPLD